MSGQHQSKRFDGPREMFVCQGVDRVFLGVGGQNQRIVAQRVGGLKVARQLHAHPHLPELVVPGVADDARQVDGVFALGVGTEFNGHGA